MRGTIVMLLAAALASPGIASETEAAKTEDCSCARVLAQVVAGVEADYAGFGIKVDARRREAYERFKAVLKADAAGASSPDRCKEVLDTYMAFFQDHHVFVLRTGPEGETGAGKKAARGWTEAGARAEIDRHRERLDPVEGLWYAKGARYAVLHEAGAPAGTFSAVRLDASGKASLDLAAVLRREPGGYRAEFRDSQGRWQTAEAGLRRSGALLVFGIDTWGRLHPAVKAARLDPADPRAPYFARLDADTLYLSLPSFLDDYRAPLDAVVAAHGEEMAKARGLVIDLRGNGGGSAIYFGLAPYLLSGPLEVSEANQILASERNLQILQKMREGWGDAGKPFDPGLQRMRENPGKLVPLLERQTEDPGPLAPGPTRVAILVDRGVGSAAEAMVLHARQSARVIVVGENTRGNIDYQQAMLSPVGCGANSYYLGVPLYTRTRTLPAGALDVVGITPDVPVPDSLADPLSFAVRLLAVP